MATGVTKLWMQRFIVAQQRGTSYFRDVVDVAALITWRLGATRPLDWCRAGNWGICSGFETLLVDGLLTRMRCQICPRCVAAGSLLWRRLSDRGLMTRPLGCSKPGGRLARSGYIKGVAHASA